MNDHLRVECERRFLDSLSFDAAEEMCWALCASIEFLKEDHPEHVRQALSLAAVVSYGRPFTVQRDRHGKSEKKRHFGELYMAQITDPKDHDLHNRMMRLRNKFLGHSDAGAARIRFPKEPGTATLQVVKPLRDDDAIGLRDLCMRLQQVAQSRYFELRPQVTDLDDDMAQIEVP